MHPLLQYVQFEMFPHDCHHATIAVGIQGLHAILDVVTARRDLYLEAGVVRVALVAAAFVLCAEEMETKFICIFYTLYCLLPFAVDVAWSRDAVAPSSRRP